MGQKGEPKKKHAERKVAPKMELHDIALKIVAVIAGIFTGMAIGLMGCGIAILEKSEEKSDEVTLLNDLPLVTISYVLLFIGVALAFISACGTYGAWRENRFFLTIFLFSLFSFMLVQLCMGVFLYLYERDSVLDDIVQDFWFEEGEDARQKRLDYQNFFDCCGWANPFDSRASGYSTACPRMDPISCRQATLDWLAEFYTPVAVFAIVFAMLEIIGLTVTTGALFISKPEEDEFFIPW